MSEAAAIEAPKVMEKVFSILKKELSAEEYLVYLQTITPRIGNSTKELRDITKKMSLEEVLRKAKLMEKSLNA
jgi:hypothetical protein